VLIGGAAINRDFGFRALFPGGKDSDEPYAPGVFYCKDAFDGLHKMDRIVDAEQRAQLVEETLAAARRLRAKGPEPEALPTDDASVRSAARTDTPVPTPPWWGPRAIDVDLDEVYRHLDTHVLFKLHWGGRGVKGEAWRTLVDEDFRPRLERMWAEQDYLRPAARVGFFPCYSEGNELVVLDPEDRETVLERLVFPRQPRHDRICLADFYRPKDSGELDVVALQAVTAGDGITERTARLEAEGEFAEQLFVHGLGVQTAEGMAEWVHATVREGLGIGLDQGRRYSWGYPACPDQSEHEKVARLLGFDELGIRLSGGWALEPEQSTVAIVAHHPQAVYFGMKSGRLPEEASPDDVIAGSQRDPSRLDDDLPEEDLALSSSGRAGAE
jgi:5-methyltetrahydrofolate--homocysteine methyltransferase